MPGRQTFNERVEEVESKPLTAFDKLSNEFAVVSESIKSQSLKVWSCNLGISSHNVAKVRPFTEYSPEEDGKGEIITAIHWLNGVKQGVDGRKKKSADQAKPSLLAIGHASGLVVLYSPAFAKVVRSLPGFVGAEVTSMTSSPDGHYLYVASSSGHVSVYNVLKNTTPHSWRPYTGKVSSLALLPDGSSLAVAHSQVQIWDMSLQPTLKATLSGHASQIDSLAVAQSAALQSCYLFTAAQNDRFIYAWKILPDEVEKSPTIAAFSLSSDYSPQRIYFCESTGDLVAMCTDGVIALWSIENTLTKLATKQPAKRKRQQRTFVPATVISSANASASLLDVKLWKDAVVYAQGLPFKPQFGSVSYKDEQGNYISSVTMEEGVSNLFLQQKDVTAAPADISGNERVAAGIAVGSQPKKPVASVPGVTMEEKMKALGLLQSEASKPAYSKKETVADTQAKTVEESFEISESGVPSASSLHQLAKQAVQSGDSVLLEKCLQVTATKVIETTVCRLEPALVIPLLDKLVVRFQNRPARGSSLLLWMQAVLVHHMNYLLTVPDLLQQLSSLYRALEARTTIYQKMLRLSGRLDLVLSQMELRRRVAKGHVFDESQRTVLYDENAQDDAGGENEFIEQDTASGDDNESLVSADDNETQASTENQDTEETDSEEDGDDADMLVDSSESEESLDHISIKE